jgi:uncharacterized membrane-anchored protein YitT (DUF2179 family)
MAGPGTPADPASHTLLDDAQGLVFGSAMGAVGVTLLGHLGLVTGQTAGLALLIALWTGLEFGVVFFAINLPFYWLAWRRLGPAFTVKTFIAIALVSVFTLVQPHLFNFGDVEPLTGAIVAGMIAGAGLLALFRHRASLGGIGVLGVYLQDRFGIRAGWIQMAVDTVIFGLALLLLDFGAVVYSLIGAVVLNTSIAVNHRRDRYVAV